MVGLGAPPFGSGDRVQHVERGIQDDRDHVRSGRDFVLRKGGVLRQRRPPSPPGDRIERGDAFERIRRRVHGGRPATDTEERARDRGGPASLPRRGVECPDPVERRGEHGPVVYHRRADEFSAQVRLPQHRAGGAVQRVDVAVDAARVDATVLDRGRGEHRIVDGAHIGLPQHRSSRWAGTGRRRATGGSGGEGACHDGRPRPHGERARQPRTYQHRPAPQPGPLGNRASGHRGREPALRVQGVAGAPSEDGQDLFGARSQRRVLGQARGDHLPQRALTDPVEPRRLVQYPVHRLGHIARPERTVAGEREDEHPAEGEDIAHRCHLVAGDVFRRHVPRRADHGTGAGQRASVRQRTGDAESITRGPASDTSTLAGVRSRCTTPAAWIAPSASAMPAASTATAASGSGPC